MPDLVLSVPEPDISFHFLIQCLKILNQAPKNPIQCFTGDPIRSPVRQHFSSNITGLATSSEFRLQPKRPPVARIAALDTVSITTKANLKAGSTAWDKRGSFMRRRWSLAIAGLIVILAGGLLAHLTQTSGGIRMCALSAPRATP
jgi:hypothetical protein